VTSSVSQSSTAGSSGTINVSWNAPSAGVYYVGLKLDAKDFRGLPLPSPATVHFNFFTVGVSGSTAGVDLVRRGSFASFLIDDLFLPYGEIDIFGRGSDPVFEKHDRQVFIRGPAG
jgi:hypothetical protein